MRMPTKLSIITLVGAGALLLCVLAAIIAFRAQVANASINPPHPDSHGSYVEVALVDTNVAPGNTWVSALSSTVCPAQAVAIKMTISPTSITSTNC